MVRNPLLQQLAQRMDGDRKAMSQAQDILRAMIDRKLWRQMQAAQDIPPGMEEIETFLERKNIFFRKVMLTDGWWNCCTGRMIGFMATDDTPVLLQPGFSD